MHKHAYTAHMHIFQCMYVLIHAHLFILSYIVTPAPCRQLLPQFVHLQNALFIVCRKQMRFLYVVVVVVVVLFTVVFSAALFVNMHMYMYMHMYLYCMYVQVNKYICMHICMYECSTLPQPVYLFAVLSLSLSVSLAAN